MKASDYCSEKLPDIPASVVPKTVDDAPLADVFIICVWNAPLATKLTVTLTGSGCPGAHATPEFTKTTFS